MSKCICNSFTIQFESTPGEFYDPKGKLPVNKDGIAYLPLWFGCPKHKGRTNRRVPTKAQHTKLFTVCNLSSIRSEDL